MKVYIQKFHDWVSGCSYSKEWNDEHSKMIELLKTSKEKVVKDNEFEPVTSPKVADVIWLLGSVFWRQIDPLTLSRKKVVCTVHTIQPDELTKAGLKEFKQRDQFVDAYHVRCEAVKKDLEPLTKKPIFCQPLWINQNYWFPKNKYELRRSTKYQIENDAFLIGSFQVDGELNDHSIPVLSKGPDVFCDLVEALHKMEPNIQVLLAGPGRRYVANRLHNAGIRYHHQEMVDISTLNDFYNMIDLYIVGSRLEGGPKNIFECAATRTPIISTRVGYASELLSDKCMIDNGATWRGASDEETLDYNFNKVQEFFIPNGFVKFESMIRKVGNL